MFSKKFFKKNKYPNGRTKQGKILVRYRCKRITTTNISVDLKRVWSTQQAIIVAIKLKTTNNNYIALIKYANGSLSFIYLPNGLFLGDYTNTQTHVYRIYKKILLGRRIPLKYVKRFAMVFNVSIRYKSVGMYAISSGTYCSLLRNYKDFNISKVKLPSGKRYAISSDCFVTLGRNTNIKKKYQVLGGAKYSRYNGHRSSVRGVAMNPVDHPHGGNTKTNKPEVSIWGWVTKHSH